MILGPVSKPFQTNSFTDKGSSKRSHTLSGGWCFVTVKELLFTDVNSFSDTNPVSPGQPAGTDAFFPFSAADMPPPSPQSNDIAIRELSGRGIPSVAAVAPEEEIPATDNGK